jgi:hypothetical protein
MATIEDDVGLVRFLCPFGIKREAFFNLFGKGLSAEITIEYNFTTPEEWSKIKTIQDKYNRKKCLNFFNW